MSLLRYFAELFKKQGLFLYAHVSMVSKIVLFRYCLQAFLKILSDEAADMGTVKLCYACCFL